MNDYRFRGAIPPAPHASIMARVTTTTGDGEATLRLYDVIDSWGGDWGISAKEVSAALDEIGAVSTIHLRINSPGGEVWDGIAIANALREHPARIVAHVDGLAASAASLIACAADELVMGKNTQLMIHDAWGIAMGPAEAMQKAAEMLDKTSQDIAGVYADKAGGTPADWRDAMKAETWYTADEAVAAGLADSVAEPPEPAPKNEFDLSVFAYEGRAAAPAPKVTGESGPELSLPEVQGAIIHPDPTPTPAMSAIRSARHRANGRKVI